jgi:hypothetical protein
MIAQPLPRSLFAGVAATLAAALLMLPAQGTASNRMRLERARAASPNEAAVERQNASAARAAGAPAVRLQGQLAYSSRDGLTLDGEPVFVGLQTGFFPIGDRDLTTDPSGLDGVQATVFGRKLSRGVRATLLIFHAASTGSGLASLAERSTEIDPSDSDPNAGTYRQDAPR